MSGVEQQADEQPARVSEDHTEYITQIIVRTTKQVVPAGYDPQADLAERAEAEILSEQVFRGHKQVRGTSLNDALPMLNTRDLDNRVKGGPEPDVDPERVELAKRLLDADGGLCIRFDHSEGYSQYLRPNGKRNGWWDKRIVGPAHDGTEEYGENSIGLMLECYDDDSVTVMPSDDAPVVWGDE